jgi:hypothetical protein
MGSLGVAKLIVEQQEMHYAEAAMKHIVTLDGVITKLSYECFERTGSWSLGAGHREKQPLK